MKAKTRDGIATIITYITHKKDIGRVTHVMIVACSSLAFAFMLLFISHAIITIFSGYTASFSIIIPTSFNLLLLEVT